MNSPSFDISILGIWGRPAMQEGGKSFVLFFKMLWGLQNFPFLPIPTVVPRWYIVELFIFHFLHLEFKIGKIGFSNGSEPENLIFPEVNFFPIAQNLVTIVFD